MTDLIEQIRDQLYIANKLALASTYPDNAPTRVRLLDEVEALIVGDEP